MRSIILILIFTMLTGCLHHKKKNHSSVKSEKRTVRPEIEKYHKEKKRYENNYASKDPNAVDPSESEKEEKITEVRPQEDFKKKPQGSWFNWD